MSDPITTTTRATGRTLPIPCEACGATTDVTCHDLRQQALVEADAVRYRLTSGGGVRVELEVVCTACGEVRRFTGTWTRRALGVGRG